jgi:hypothetical protein
MEKAIGKFFDVLFVAIMRNVAAKIGNYMGYCRKMLKQFE